MSSYQHPITFQPTGNVRRDFQYAIESFEKNLSVYLPSDRQARILDYGCGWGQFLWWVRDKGYSSAEGIDVGVDQIEFCSSLGLQVYEVDNTLSYLEQRPAIYDLVVMNHVIEHVPAVEALDILKTIHYSMRNGARIIVQTPNMSSISANFSRYIEITHVTGYTENSLIEALELANFSEVKAFGGKSLMRLSPKRLAWLFAQAISRVIWRTMLVAELGTDVPRILDKNLFATGVKLGAFEESSPRAIVSSTVSLAQ